jgi:nucleotide sugar dehydrogenase
MGRTTHVAVIGQGYVGLPLAVSAAEHGFAVVGVEADARRLQSLTVGESYVEALSSDRLRAVMRDGSYSAISDNAMRSFDIAVITVPTPLGIDGLPDLSAIRSAGRMVGSALRPGGLAVLESTSYPGTTENELLPLLEAHSGLRARTDFDVAFSPERIDPGNQTWMLENTPKIVAGLGERATRRASEFYRAFVKDVVPMKGIREAELAKLIENAFRYVNIAFVNEISEVFGAAGIDVGESLRGAASKPFGYVSFAPGPGVGGHCLPVDVVYLDWYAKQVLGQELRMTSTSIALNSTRPTRIVEQIAHALAPEGGLVGARVALLGMSYKPDIGDTRNAPAIEIATLLHARGAHVVAVDPHVDPTAPALAGIVLAEVEDERVRGADVVVLLVAHTSFDIGSIARNARRLVDVRAGLNESQGYLSRVADTAGGSNDADESCRAEPEV